MPGLPPSLPRARPVPPPMPGESLLDIEELARFENLLVFARATVEGFFAGRHKSPYRGSAAEFADYKEYVAGDDLSRIDWRVYGRTRRLFVRQFEEETDMVVHVLVDTSNSMRYAGAKRPSKYRLAAKIAAALTYLMLAQGDKTALALFAEKVTLVRSAGRDAPASTSGHHDARSGETGPRHRPRRGSRGLRATHPKARENRHPLRFPRRHERTLRFPRAFRPSEVRDSPAANRRPR